MSKELLQDIIEDLTPEKFVRFFREKNRTFAPRKEELFQYNDENFQHGIKLGEIQFAQDENMLICVFEARHPLSERSGKKAQYEKGKKILKDSQSDAGIFIFHDTDNNFRFSLIYAEYLGVRRRFSYFKRLTFFVSPRLTNKTFLQQIGACDFSSFKSIKEAFSVEPVTRQFYGELQYWYFWAMDKIKFPDDYKYSNDPAKDKEIRNATNLIRLITRIIFIWFIAEKGLIPSELFSREKLGRIVKDFMKGKKVSNFYNTILQNLFFGTLNQKMEERKFAQQSGFQTNRKEYGVKNLYRYGDKFLISKNGVLELFNDIPFLNGGLFDCLDKENGVGKVIYVDGFSRNLAKQSIIPDYLFFQQEEEKVNLSNYGLGASRPVRGLIEILNSYNFTIDENTPVDQEIALDPELLGKVFENLLASYNPETATTARKATGSYYTPREIVDYMVEESLFEYLKGKLSENEEEKIRLLLSYSEEKPEFSEPERQKIISAIDDIKILDPACGSGAFPMGILNKLVYTLQKLDPTNKYWHELQYQKALKESEEVFQQDDKNERLERLKDINETFDEGINYPDYARKLYLIENCIYGVDIQPIAIQISKLRFFISLVLDQKVDRGKENLGIRALPNLETKFVAANTLIGLDIPKEDLLSGISEIKPIQDELAKERHKYFSAKTRNEKKEYQKQDKKLREKLAEIIKKLLINKKQGDIIQIKILIDGKKLELQQITQEPDHIEVIELSNLFGEKEQIKIDKNKEKIERIKLGIKASEKQLKNLQKQVEGDSVIKIAKKIATFDLYDQNASADFFDPEWMFGITDGFDVVIGNPPYGAEIDGVDSLAKNYKHFDRQKNSASFFIEVGNKLTDSKGVIAYIIPKSLSFSEGWKKTRELVTHKNRLLSVIDVCKAFEAVLLEQIIICFSKETDGSAYQFSVGEGWDGEIKVRGKGDNKLIDQLDILPIYADNRKQNILNKLRQGSILISQISKTFRGLPFQNKVSKSGLPILRGKNIGKYKIYGAIDNITLPKEILSSAKVKELLKPKIISQRLVAHVMNPYDRIIIMATIDKQGFLTLDTVMNTYLTVDKFMLQYVLAILNSQLASWFYYWFVFNRAVRTMDFDKYYIGKLPVKDIDLKAQHPFIILVDQILAAKKKDPNADTSALEHQIDEMIYALYGLTPEEIAIVEGKK